MMRAILFFMPMILIDHVFFSACTLIAADGPATPGRGVDFDTDVQPILAARCQKCHGAGVAEAGLRLNSREGAIRKLESGLAAVVAGDTEHSELLNRIASDDEAMRMPPEGPPLTPAEVTALREWIQAGADWPAHWAYRPLQKPAVPAVVRADGSPWSDNPIDQFVLAKLQERGLTPSEPSDKRTLLRRISYDLTGLPPTAEMLDTFLTDTSAEAWERLVDRLLASPQYGERWARHWMDLVHYAETHGHDQDRPRENAWPYRDYLIRSFNDDKPYGRFVEEQVAGDVLYPDEPSAIVATGLLATGPWDESSLQSIREDSIDHKIAMYIDRDDIVTTVMSSFASTTVHCARCHDHKFDPVSQAEYYGLQAVFAGIGKAERDYDADPETALRRRDLLAAQQRLTEQHQQRDQSLLADSIQSQVSEWEQTARSMQSIWKVATPVDFQSESGTTLTQQDDGSVLAGGERPEKDVYTVTLRCDLPRLTGIRLEVLSDPSLPMSGPGRQDNGNLHLNEFTAMATRDQSADSGAGEVVSFGIPQADFNQSGWTIEMAVDGNPATAWGIYPEVGKSHRAVFPLLQPLDDAHGLVVTVQLHQLHGGGHLIGRPRISFTAAPLDQALSPDVLPADISAILRMAADMRSDQQRIDLTAYVLQQRLSGELAALPKPSKIYCGTNLFKADGSFRPTEVPRPVFVLYRGDITQPQQAAAAGALSCVTTLPSQWDDLPAADEGARRAALARWLSDQRNPLTWRSIANRVWQHHFGRALVTTPNDFGQMGAAPTHPELLDWLATMLQENGGSLKSLHRLILTSATYRQSSAFRQDCATVDTDNRWLWRVNRRSLDAESIRDSLLLISGSLDTTMGGPSVRQFVQKPGIHVTPDVNYTDFDVNDPANNRRSVYRFMFRTLPDPFMEALNCPDASQLTPQRTTSFTALQALAMINNQFVVRQSQLLAECITAEEEDLSQQVAIAYRLILLRSPVAEETVAVSEFVKNHGWANACRFLFNSNEFLFVD